MDIRPHGRNQRDRVCATAPRIRAATSRVNPVRMLVAYQAEGYLMNNIIYIVYIVGVIVIVMALLSFFGLR